MDNYSFYRTELRVLRSICATDLEFITKVAEMIGNLNQKLESAETRAGLAEHEVRLWENGEKQ